VKVALTNVSCWPEVRRGTEALLQGLGGWLASRGHDVTVVAGARTPGRHTIDGVRYLTVAARDLTRVSRQLTGAVTMIPAMAAALRRLRPDVVHSFLYQDATAAQLARLPTVVSYGGIALPSSFRGRPVDRRLFAAASRRARAVVCPSRAAADHLAEAFGIDAEVIPNGLDVSAFAVDEPRDPGLVLCAATPNDRRKRAEVLIDAANLLDERGMHVELAFAGAVDDDRRRALLQRRPSLTFLGELAGDALARAYARATVSCLPSVNEAFGMVVVESLAAGTPVVGAAHGALPELLTEEVGSTFEADDADALADALVPWLQLGDDDGVRLACRRHARRYDWSAVGPQIVDLYDRCA
jgi:phosphatidyl-myo-inositol alpha-mannosyltransferase